MDGIQLGETIRVSINIESREYNGRWYTDVRAWRIQKESDAQSNSSTAVNDAALITPSQTTSDYNDFGSTDMVDDLPF